MIVFIKTVKVCPAYLCYCHRSNLTMKFLRTCLLNVKRYEKAVLKLKDILFYFKDNTPSQTLLLKTEVGQLYHYDLI